MVHIMNIMGLGRAAMARNAVQFQKGLSEAAFEDLSGTEAKCRELVMRWRWPNGFECPVCGGTSDSEVKTRGLFQCSACRRQTALIAGTIFAASKVALRVWFRAMYHLTQSKQGISSIELGRRLGVTQTTAWTIQHKLAQVMMERDAEQQLNGRVELDEPISAASAPAASEAAAQRARRPSSPPSRQHQKASRCASSCAGSAASATTPSPASPSAASIPPARWSAMASPASLLSPKPDASTR